MTRADIIINNPIERIMASYGVEVSTRTPNGFMVRCPFHEDSNPSLSVDTAKGLFHCHGCKVAGSVIDFVRLKENISPGEAMRKLAPEATTQRFTPTPTAISKPREAVEGEPKKEARIVAEYSYRDATGQELYQVVRMEPKDFRQRHKVDGKWVWNMQGVDRVLYNLPAILTAKNSFIWVVEGEKDAENLKKCGFISTCNVGGAGKWLEGYTESLAGKEVVICGDNDEAGRKHVATVIESIANAVKCIHLVKIPSPHKDASDFMAAFPNTETAAEQLFALFEDATVLNRGVEVPVRTMAELEREYQQSIETAKTGSYSLSRWLPDLGKQLRSLVPGELVTILAGTSVGKTACLQNIALSARPIPTLLFELELPGSLTFERFVSLATKIPSWRVEQLYASAKSSEADWRKGKSLDHVSVCTRPRLSPEDIERIILQTELKTGTRPVLVLVDYMGLIQGSGKSRYEKTSDNAEALRIIAKATKTIIILASQISRKGSDMGPEVFLSDAKDSGSIENSSSLLIGAWRDPDDKTKLHMKILKNTKGITGVQTVCNFDGATMTIASLEPPQLKPLVDERDVPVYR